MLSCYLQDRKSDTLKFARYKYFYIKKFLDINLLNIGKLQAARHKIAKIQTAI